MADDPQGEVERVAHALCADMNSNDPRAIERVFDETDSKWDHARSCYRKWAGIAIAALRPSAGAEEIEGLLTAEQLEDARTKANIALASDEASWHTKQVREAMEALGLAIAMIDNLRGAGDPDKAVKLTETGMISLQLVKDAHARLSSLPAVHAGDKTS